MNLLLVSPSLTLNTPSIRTIRALIHLTTFNSFLVTFKISLSLSKLSQFPASSYKQPHYLPIPSYSPFNPRPTTPPQLSPRPGHHQRTVAVRGRSHVVSEPPLSALPLLCSRHERQVSELYLHTFFNIWCPSVYLFSYCVVYLVAISTVLLYLSILYLALVSLSHFYSYVVKLFPFRCLLIHHIRRF